MRFWSGNKSALMGHKPYNRIDYTITYDDTFWMIKYVRFNNNNNKASVGESNCDDVRIL